MPACLGLRSLALAPLEWLRFCLPISPAFRRSNCSRLHSHRWVTVHRVHLRIRHPMSRRAIPLRHPCSPRRPSLAERSEET